MHRAAFRALRTEISSQFAVAVRRCLSSSTYPHAHPPCFGVKGFVFSYLYPRSFAAIY